MPKHLYLLLLLALAGCLQEPSPQLSPSNEQLILATTTSVYDSGLLQALIPPFEAECGCRVKVIAQGTGAALKKAELGGADVVIVHAPGAEKKFVADGFGINRRAIMHNDFVIIGSDDDPAGIKGMNDASVALKKISETEADFYSRGDDSGTHKKEQTLWQKSGTPPQGSWYKHTGVGMGATIIISDQSGGYTLSDRSTYLTRKDIGLVVLSEGDPALLNPYSVIAVNPAKNPHVNYQLSMSFIGYLTSLDGQKIIKEFGLSEYGESLFSPDALPPEVLG